MTPALFSRWAARRARPLASLLAAALLAAGAAIAAPAVPPAAAATSACTVSYSIVNSWPGGFQAGITITNNAAALTGWTLAFTFPDDQQVSNGWGGNISQNGQSVSVTSASYDGSLGTGGSATVGFVASVSATNSVPSSFTVNGYACNGAAQVPTVQLTSPAAGTDTSPGASVTLTASAAEPTALITKVEFLATSIVPGTSHTPVLLATSAASPYSYTWASVPAGYYDLTAEAFDSAGASATSAPIQLSVVGSADTAPQLHVSGNKLVDAGGTPVVLHRRWSARSAPPAPRTSSWSAASRGPMT